MQNEGGLGKETMAVEVGIIMREGGSVRAVTELDSHKQRREEIL